MSTTTLMIVGAILTFYLGNRLSEWLNVLSAGRDMPEQLRGVFQPDHQQRSRAYLKSIATYEFLKNTAALACLLAFWFAGGFAVADEFARSLGFSPLITGTLFVVAYVIAIDVVKVPFYIYQKLRIEREFGLGRTTLGLFFADYLKNLFFKLLMLPWPVLGMLWIFERMGEDSFLYVWLFVSVCAVLVQDVALPLLGPAFNKYRPLEAGEARSAIAAYAEKVGFPCRDILVVDSSKRTIAAGAAIDGFGARKNIVLPDTLLGTLDRDELIAVVALAIGRDRFHNRWLALAGTVGMVGLMFYLITLFIREPSVFEAFGVQPSIYLGLIFFSIVFPPVELVFAIIRHSISRQTQAKADAFAVETTGKPASVASALKKLTAKTLSTLTPHPVYVLLNHPKPPLAQRLQWLGSRDAASPSAG